MTYPHIKRALDLSCAVFLLALLSPALLILGATLLVFQGRPLFFIQERPGLNGAIFRMIKFRTLKRVAGHSEFQESTLVPTRLGSLLRRLSVDEVPQLVNIVRGQMSFVGPRPLLPQYLPLYDNRQRTRHAVRPGMTGLAQVEGRNFVAWEKRLELDAVYVEKMSLPTDAKILIKTIWIVIKRVGVADHGSENDSIFSNE